MKFEHCIRCTICVENCPVFRVNPEFPGPKQAGPDAQRFRSERDKAQDGWVLLCSQCKRCEMACPCGVEPAQIILKAQQRYGNEHPQTPAHLLFANNYYLSALGSFTAPLANVVASTQTGKKIFQKMGISTYLPFPKFSFRTMRREKKRLNKGRKKVAFFYGCFINFYRPDIGRKIIRLLASMNVDVVLPPQWCCGLPALGNGNLTLARYFAKKNAESLSNYIDAGYDVIYTCTSCGLCLLHDYPGILEIPQGRKIAENSYDVHEYIIKLINEGYVKPDFREVRRSIAYHIPCHLRALKIGYPAAKLMSLIPGLEYEILDDACCGLSGSYGFKKENALTAIQIGNRAVSLISKTGMDNIVSDCGSCRMQLAGLSGMPALDPAEIIFDSLGR
ncbi:MAG TPA: anaerobic glycerol-3-phosphate dehydrogenase subunit C [Smithella sp.]|nr:anaerobic glycerol-3-phosphate dehydrogenase subunit C [Smithella sp.]NMC96835.1 anaerobic glycerol-3-phosphate dehydrogenase subunit C [Deltaproteobacteria bacterium]OQC53343.1 MAG: Anaerobic glycerol-3-phosphate dehydrogenase subunit C [Deltaproteobacteria bacterium ADurb.Bin022]HNQ65961.1 anaerobic glycerol-3-phosphate dehydrogenase subunit C [Smithella sp.]HOE31724.1 anaerobic glycerol-3-phosphate dehydrogenase subunit C [Smithella sp.]